MTIIKKSGKKEEFSLQKLSRSISAACKDANAALSEQEVKEIALEFQQIVSGKNLITTHQIDIIICGLLYVRGYENVLEHYSKFGDDTLK